jgi:catechol-2,3-dioxygenase
MPTIGFAHYNLRAPRVLLEELAAFYCEVVGLAAGHRPPFESFGYWLYAGEHDVLHLSEAAPSESRPSHIASTFDHAAFTCTGLVEFERLLAQKGIQYEVASVPLTGQVQLFFRDPAGNGVELNFSDAAAG